MDALRRGGHGLGTKERSCEVACESGSRKKKQTEMPNKAWGLVFFKPPFTFFLIKKIMYAHNKNAFFSKNTKGYTMKNNSPVLSPDLQSLVSFFRDIPLLTVSVVSFQKLSIMYKHIFLLKSQMAMQCITSAFSLSNTSWHPSYIQSRPFLGVQKPSE